MSTILNALRKLEEEQPEQEGARPADLELKVRARGADEPARPGWRIVRVGGVVVFAALAGAGVTLAVLSLWQTHAVEGPPGPAGRPTSVAAPAISPAQRAEEPIVVVVADVLKQRTSELAALGSGGSPAQSAEPSPQTLKQRSGDRLAQFETVSAGPTGPLPDLATSKVPKVARIVREGDPAQTSPLQTTPLQTTPEQVASVVVERVDVVSDRLPVIVREAVPSVTVMRTTWHPRRARRLAKFSVLEGSEVRMIELREGQFIGPLELVEIGPAGVVFRHQGVEIRRRLGAPQP